MDRIIACLFYIYFDIAPAMTCNKIPSLLRGAHSNFMILNVNWTLIDTGGQPLERVEISYTIPPSGALGLSSVTNLEQSSIDLNISSVNIHAGVYQFNITATNSVGASTVSCPSLNLGKTMLYIIIACTNFKKKT